MKLLISLTSHAQQLVYTCVFIFFKMGIFPGKFFPEKNSLFQNLIRFYTDFSNFTLEKLIIFIVFSQDLYFFIIE